MKSILTKIRSLIRRARVSLSLPDTGTYPIAQVEFLGKTSNMVVIWPYGSGGQLPEDAEVICFNIEGMEENKAGIGTAPTIRFKVDAPGETWSGNPLSGSVTYYRENGDIEVVCKNNKIVTVDSDMNVTVSGDVNITVTGDVNLNASNVNITAADSINLDGGDGNLAGVITAKSICPVTGNPHVDPSLDVLASHA